MIFIKTLNFGSEEYSKRFNLFFSLFQKQNLSLISWLEKYD